MQPGGWVSKIVQAGVTCTGFLPKEQDKVISNGSHGLAKHQELSPNG